MMTHYTWEDPRNRAHFSRPPTDAKTLEFTRDGIEQLQEDVITFLDQFDEMPQPLVDEICQVIVNYYIKHRDHPDLDK